MPHFIFSNCNYWIYRFDLTFTTFIAIMEYGTYIYQIHISSFKLRAMYIMNRPFDTSLICFVQNQDLLVFAFEQQNIEQLVNWLPISRLLEHVLRILHLHRQHFKHTSLKDKWDFLNNKIKISNSQRLQMCLIRSWWC